MTPRLFGDAHTHTDAHTWRGGFAVPMCNPLAPLRDEVKHATCTFEGEQQECSFTTGTPWKHTLTHKYGRMFNKPKHSGCLQWWFLNLQKVFSFWFHQAMNEAVWGVVGFVSWLQPVKTSYRRSHNKCYHTIQAFLWKHIQSDKDSQLVRNPDLKLSRLFMMSVLTKKKKSCRCWFVWIYNPSRREQRHTSAGSLEIRSLWLIIRNAHIPTQDQKQGIANDPLPPSTGEMMLEKAYVSSQEAQENQLWLYHDDELP